MIYNKCNITYYSNKFINLDEMPDSLRIYVIKRQLKNIQIT